MSYLVLARKWRPRTFASLVGQEHVVRALTHALDTQRLHHAWLFTGTRGVGKTTLSRLLAKSLNCEQGITATPCGQCQACTEIDAGRFVDYVELDAASNRGVDEMTQLLEQAVYAPGAGRFKVYMIDEVHMLTGHAFNAMLKTLEEPPPHVKFILATTDPQKIPVTVLSRCLQFNLKQIPPGVIVAHLQDILSQEGIAAEVPALQLLARAADGSMRDALSLTDQAIAYSAENLTLDAIQEMLGTIDQRYLVRLLQALAQADAQTVLQIATELSTRGLSYQGALADLAVLLSRVAIAQRVGPDFDADNPLAGELAALAQNLHPDLVQLFYSIAVHSRTELSLAPDEYAGFVMACLRMLALVPDDGSGLSGPSSGGSSRLPQGAGVASSTVDSPGNEGATGVAQAALVQAAVQPGNSPDQAVPSSSPKTATSFAGPVSLKEVPSVVSAPTVVAQSTQPEKQQHTSPSGQTQAPTTEAVPAWEGESSWHEGAVLLASDEASAPGALGTSAQDTVVAPLSGDSAPPVALEGAKTGLSQTTDAGLPGSMPSVVAESDASEASAVAGRDDDAFSYGDEYTSEAPPFDDAPAYDEVLYGSDLDETEAQTASLAGLQLAGTGAVADVAAGRPKKPSRTQLSKMTAADWPALVVQLPLGGVAAELARQSEWVDVEGLCITLRVAVQTFTEAEAGKERLCTVLSEHFGEVVSLKVLFGSTGDGTAHAIEQSRLRELQKQAEAAVDEDPLIHELRTRFDARVVPDSIRAPSLGQAA